MNTKPSGATIQSIERAVAILGLFEHNKELRLTMISQLAGLHKSTAFGIVHTLESMHLLEQNPETGKYRPGLMLFRLGMTVEVSAAKVCRPFLEQLSKKSGETVSIGTCDDLHVLFLDQIESHRAVRTELSRGKRMPLYCTATGRAMLAYMEPESVADILSRTTFHRFNERTTGGIAELKKHLAKVREDGYALCLGENELDLASIAVPVFDYRGVPVAAINISSPESRMPPARQRELAQMLLAYRAEIDAAMCWRG